MVDIFSQEHYDGGIIASIPISRTKQAVSYQWRLKAAGTLSISGASHAVQFVRLARHVHHQPPSFACSGSVSSTEGELATAHDSRHGLRATVQAQPRRNGKDGMEWVIVQFRDSSLVSDILVLPHLRTSKSTEPSVCLAAGSVGLPPPIPKVSGVTACIGGITTRSYYSQRPLYSEAKSGVKAFYIYSPVSA
ncbi:hypothetical protein CYLTODRAFT_120402 [Cylindrobasidium torrendii FP15055 ss-10]|uniref:Uncharacterized protein n=1 Tax=Cylindrobasidium torrendii FP15055 ss-10 TaxID=1314674 RepID=A0A0D7B173_9AGAR|nr:hypothetical protein CYLTODRAFT_120402 [Cylindrobasidium torrendii FP15055 ss-10]